MPWHLSPRRKAAWAGNKALAKAPFSPGDCKTRVAYKQINSIWSLRKVTVTSVQFYLVREEKQLSQWGGPLTVLTSVNCLEDKAGHIERLPSSRVAQTQKILSALKMKGLCLS